MLFALTLLFQILLFANPSPALKDCMTNVLINRGHTLSTLEAKRIGNGEASLSKEFRQHMANSVPGKYDKHIKAKTIQQAIKLSGKGMEHAQYIPGINRVNLEKHALVEMKGFYKAFKEGGKKGTIYKFVKFQDDIGFDGGKGTKWLRVEWSSGSYHGHPISAKRLLKQCSECIP
jgi:hypothetical protein